MSLRLLCLLAGTCAIAADGSRNETFVLLNGGTGKTTVQNGRRARERFAPCSTFKIANSLIALDSRMAPDAAFPLEYDPKRDGPQSGAWARDHDLRSAIRTSVVWYYKELARRIGGERMQAYLDRFEYGNRDISAGIDQFWLGRGLRISAGEQTAFLKRFYENRLGVSPQTTAIVKDLLLLESTAEYRWYGKTGTCSTLGIGPIAWHAGFVERDSNVFFYALNVGGSTLDEVSELRKRLIREKLSQAGLIESEPPSRRRQMEARVNAAIEAFPGTVSLYARNLDTGETFGVREDQRVRTASTIKLPIMAAVFSAVAQKKAAWNESLELTQDSKVPGSGVLTEFSEGLKLSLRDAVHLMIVVSDNTATNLILNRFTADFVNQELAALGLVETRSLRKILGRGQPQGQSREGLMEEFQRFGIGVSTQREMVMLLEKLERREVIDPESSNQMLAILKRQQYKDGIGRQLPYNEVASKSGALDRLRSDVGIVYSTGGRIALAFTVDDMLRTDYSAGNAGNVLISQLTGIILEGLAAPVHELSAAAKTVELQAHMDHVQGIEVEGDRLWVTWVDRKQKTGHLGEFELSSGKMLRSVTVHNGDRFHPGGIASDGDSLWIPVAEYRPNSSAVIQRRNKNTLELESQFAAGDHIGCVAVDGGRIYGGNWDSRQIYIWDRGGELIEVRENTSGTSFQDMKTASGKLIGAGLRHGGGSIDWLDPKDLRLLRRIRAGKTDRGVILTHEGMAISGDRLYLLPEDAPSRLFVFPLPNWN